MNRAYLQRTHLILLLLLTVLLSGCAFSRVAKLGEYQCNLSGPKEVIELADEFIFVTQLDCGGDLDEGVFSISRRNLEAYRAPIEKNAVESVTPWRRKMHELVFGEIPAIRSIPVYDSNKDRKASETTIFISNTNFFGLQFYCQNPEIDCKTQALQFEMDANEVTYRRWYTDVALLPLYVPALAVELVASPVYLVGFLLIAKDGLILSGKD